WSTCVLCVFLTYLAMKAAILIQRRYTWNIFQSIEYIMHFPYHVPTSMHHKIGYTDSHQDNQVACHTYLISHLLDSVVDPLTEEVRQLKYEQIVMPESYCGPRLSFPLSVTDTNVLLSAFKEEQTLHGKYVLQLLYETKKFLKQMPNVIYLSTSYAKEITICGDLHGRLDDLLLIFYKNGLPSTENPYIFNGDFVDRGKKSTEIIIILFAFLLLYPDHMHLNRGNHEDHIMNLRYGFTKETHGREILQLLQDVFSLLPLATVIDNKVLIVHGGISDKTDLDFLSTVERHKVKSALRLPKRSIDHLNVRACSRSSSRHSGRSRLDSPCSSGRTSRASRRRKKQSTRQGSCSSSSSSSSFSSSVCSPRISSRNTPHRPPPSPSLPSPTDVLQVPFLDSFVSLEPPEPPREELEWQQVVDILWSDPKNQNGCGPNSFRGGGCYFGPDVTQALLQKHGLCLLIRSHECKQEGYELCHNGQVITIFSASNYYEEGSNRGAYIKLGPELVPRFFQYQVSRSTRKLTLHQRVRVAEGSALRALKEKLYAHRSELRAAFQQYDIDNTGRISTSEWAQVVESVLRLDLPWRTLRPRLARLSADEKIWLPNFNHIYVTPNLAETLYRYRTDLEIIFNIIDKDHSGQISIEEFRQTWKLFSSHLGVAVNDQTIDDMARSIDFNKDGSIDFNEFLEALRVVHKLDVKEQQQG
uniref:Serine/threonine-protein phosphatase with EF-hands n=1 Tax=Sinocyclocheilus anshuiensis TaxID=1608454 RepID=A0A671T415_9TELE